MSQSQAPRRTLRSVRDSSPSAIETRLVRARDEHRIPDIEYDEVDSALDVVLGHARRVANDSTAKLRDLAERIDALQPARAKTG